MKPDRETDELVAICERGRDTALRATGAELLRRLTLTENERHAHRAAGRSIEAAACAIREQALREAIAVLKVEALALPLRAWVQAGRYTCKARRP